MMKRALALAALTVASAALTSGVASAATAVPGDLVRPDNGNVLQNLGAGLSLLTSDCNTVLGPLTGYQSGVVTSALLDDGRLLGDLTGTRTGVLRDLTYDAFVGDCGRLGAGG